MNPLYYSDGYKPGHKKMLAPGTSRLFGNCIPRSIKYAPHGVTKIPSAGHQMTWMWLHNKFQKKFFGKSKKKAMKFGRDMSMYVGHPYDYTHLEELYDLGYLPIEVQALPEGIETNPNIPHQTYINTVDGFGWLPLFLETIISAIFWKIPTTAAIGLQYRRNVEKYCDITNPEEVNLRPYLCHDFSARGLDPYSMMASGMGFAFNFRGSDTMAVIPASRKFYGVGKKEMPINSVEASEHSVTCTGIFYYEKPLKQGKLNDKISEYYSYDCPTKGSIENPDYLAIAEWLNLNRWLDDFYDEKHYIILSVVSDTFDFFKLVTQILPRLKEKIMKFNGKLVVRPDSGDPADIVCGHGINYFDITVHPDEIDSEMLADIWDSGFRAIKANGYIYKLKEVSAYDIELGDMISDAECKGAVELLYDIFGGTITSTGYKQLDSHIGLIYGDSINLYRQIDIYSRLMFKRFAITNVVLGVGSFTMQYQTRDSLGWALKGAWFEVLQNTFPDNGTYGNYTNRESYNIYKDPVTDDGTKKSLKGFQFVYQDESGEYQCESEVDEVKAYSAENILQTIYRNGKFYNFQNLEGIRQKFYELARKY